MAPRVVKLYSENNDFQHAEVLKRNREKRNRYGEFLVEGVKCINAARASGWKINSLYYCPAKQLSDWARDMLENSGAGTHFELTPELMEKLSDKEETSELLAVAAIPADDLSRIGVHAGFLAVIFDRPASPGNLGTSIRCCEAFGADGVIITGHAVDLYHPHTVRGSMGALFSLPVVRLPSHKEVLEWLGEVKSKTGALRVIGTSPDGALSIAGQDFQGPVVLVMGNETHGMSAAYRELCTEIVRIDTPGRADSLNISCACAICLYQIQAMRGRPANC